MPTMSIIVATADARRFYAAMEAAMAWSALGHDTRIFLQGEAVALLREPIRHSGDEVRMAAGQPGLAGMIEEANAMNVSMAVCQTGMTMVGMTATDIDTRVKTLGLISFLAEITPDDDMLVY